MTWLLILLFKEIRDAIFAKSVSSARRHRWGLINSSRERIAESLPHLEGDLADLASVTKEIASLAAKQAYYVGKAREFTGKLRLLSKHGDRVRGRIGASLRGKFGYVAAELIQYGFTPRRTGTLESQRTAPTRLRPGPQLNTLVLGVLGRAQRRYGARLISLLLPVDVP